MTLLHHCIVVSTVLQSRTKILGSNLLLFCVELECSLSLPQSKNMQFNLVGDYKTATGLDLGEKSCFSVCDSNCVIDR